MIEARFRMFTAQGAVIEQKIDGVTLAQCENEARNWPGIDRFELLNWCLKAPPAKLPTTQPTTQSCRTVVTVGDHTVNITNYIGREPTTVPTSPTRALQIARDLIAAALEL